MSRAKNTGDIEPTDEGRGIDWLERNATLLPMSDLKDTDSWDRAGEGLNAVAEVAEQQTERIE